MTRCWHAPLSLALATSLAACSGATTGSPASQIAKGLATVLNEVLSPTPPTVANPLDPLKIDGVRFDPGFATNGQIHVTFSVVDGPTNLTRKLDAKAVCAESKPLKPEDFGVSLDQLLGYRVQQAASASPTSPPAAGTASPSASPLAEASAAATPAASVTPTAIPSATSAASAMPTAAPAVAPAASALPTAAPSTTPSLAPSADCGGLTVTLPDPPPNYTVLLDVDASGSMKLSDKDRLRVKAAQLFVRALRKGGDRVGVMQFGAGAKAPFLASQLLQGITGELDQAAAAIDRVGADGGTPLYDSAFEGMELLAKESGPKAMIVLTDGADTGSKHRPPELVALAAKHQILLFMLAFGYFSEADLQTVVSQAGGLFTGAKGAEAMPGMFDAVTRALTVGSASATVVVPAGQRDAHLFQGTITAMIGGKAFPGTFNAFRK